MNNQTKIAPAFGVILFIITNTANAGTCTDDCVVNSDGDTPEIHLNDTSPNGDDWEIENIGGPNSIFQIGLKGGTDEPFKIDKSATEDTIHISGSGRVGINTSNPAEEISISSFRPGIRFTDTTSGDSDFGIVTDNDIFDIQASSGHNLLSIEFDTEGNVNLYLDSTGNIGFGVVDPTEALQFDSVNDEIRFGTTNNGWVLNSQTNVFEFESLTGSTKIPLRIEDAPTDSLVINSDGNIGIGTSSPGNALEIVRTGTAAQLQFKDSTANHKWVVGQSASNTFSMRDPDSAVQFRLFKSGNFILTNSNGTNTFTVNAAGNLVIPGTLMEGSDINSKEDIYKVNTRSILNRISQLNIANWKYKTDDKTRHIGPMAQDFHEKFSVGSDEKHISTLDTSGVALAGIQELIKQSSEKDKAIQSLQEKITKLEKNDKSILSLQDKIIKLEVLIKRMTRSED